MKNKITYIFLSAVLSLCLSGCVKGLLDHPATTNLSSDTFWQTIEDAENGVNAVYNGMKSTFGNYFYRLDCYPDADLLYFNNRSATTIEGSYWTNCYSALNRANNAIAQLRRMRSNFTSDEQLSLLTHLEGEARFIRGLHYALMIDLWGDVQYLDHVPTQQESYTIARSPIATVRDLIFEDYNFAIGVLPNSYTGDDVGRATRLAAYAFRGKLELFWASWKKNGRPEIEDFETDPDEANEYYTKAAASFAEVMKPEHGLQLFQNGAPGTYEKPNYRELFIHTNEKCSEIIFAVQYGGPLLGQGNNMQIYFGNRSVMNSWANMSPTNYLVDRYQLISTGDYAAPVVLSLDATLENGSINPATYEGRDWRMHGTIVWDGQTMMGLSADGMSTTNTVTLKWGTNGSGFLDYNDNKTGYVFRKFVREYPGFSRSDGPQDFYLMRLPDVWLMYCEAQNELNGPSGALYDLVDKIRARGSLPALDRTRFATKETFFAAIEQERAVEFVAEGQRFFDIRRWRKAEQIWNYPSGRELRNVHNGFVQNQYVNANDRTFPRYYIFGIPENERIENPNLTQNRPWL